MSSIEGSSGEGGASIPSLNFSSSAVSSGLEGILADSKKANKISTEELEFDTKFITTHKEACRVVKFNQEGTLVATGSDDASIKLIDVEKMKVYNSASNSKNFSKESAKPVIRTFYDHIKPVSDVVFHPRAAVLASSSSDQTIKFYDMTSSNKRSFLQIQEHHSVKSLDFHPSGDFLLVGTQQPLLRLYDVEKLNAFTTKNGRDNHKGSINRAKYSRDAKMFVSCSKDGSIKVWDAVNGTCINTIEKAHDGMSVTQVNISSEGKQILSSGKDGSVHLFDLSTGNKIQSYGGANHSKCRAESTWTCNEDFVIGVSDKVVVVWEALSGRNIARLSGHTNSISSIASSPSEYSFVSCSLDSRARFWVASQK